MRNALLAACVASIFVCPLVTVTGRCAATTPLSARQQQEKGSPLFLDEPSCDYYQCNVTYYPGDNATAHWLDAPDGNVVLDLMTNASSALYTRIATVPGVTNNCDAEGESTCGQFSWIVPSAWVGGNYTLRASSEKQPDIESYTDVILVKEKPESTSTSSIYFSALDPQATSSNSTTSVIGAAPTSASSTDSQASNSTPTNGTEQHSAPGGALPAFHALTMILVALASAAAGLFLLL